MLCTCRLPESSIFPPGINVNCLNKCSRQSIFHDNLSPSSFVGEVTKVSMKNCVVGIVVSIFAEIFVIVALLALLRWKKMLSFKVS